MRYQSKFLFSVFCLVLMSFVFMSSGQEAKAQDWCCNNNNAMGGNGQCVQAPLGAQSCGGANVFFEDGVNGITLAPLGDTDPPFPQSGDLCPSAAQDRDTCMCIDEGGQTVPCQTLPPPPTDPPPTDPPPTDPPPTDPPPTDSPPTDPPPTDPPPTVTPEMGCCVEAQGLCDITLESACSVPPNIEFLGEGTSCDRVEACGLQPVTEVPTMSEWGLIATAVMLGLFSLLTVRRGFRIKNN